MCIFADGLFFRDYHNHNEICQHKNQQTTSQNCLCTELTVVHTCTDFQNQIELAYVFPNLNWKNLNPYQKEQITRGNEVLHDKTAAGLYNKLHWIH